MKHPTHWNCCLPLWFHKGCNGKIAKIASAAFTFSFSNFLLVSSTYFRIVYLYSLLYIFIPFYIFISLFLFVQGTVRIGGTLRTICGLLNSVTSVIIILSPNLPFTLIGRYWWTHWNFSRPALLSGPSAGGVRWTERWEQFMALQWIAAGTGGVGRSRAGTVTNGRPGIWGQAQTCCNYTRTWSVVLSFGDDPDDSQVFGLAHRILGSETGLDWEGP